MNPKLGQKEDRRIRAHAGRAIVQLLFTRTTGLSLERVRQLLREGLLPSGNNLDRAVASLRIEELISAIIELDPALAEVGLHIEIVNGFARLLTIPVTSESLAAVLGENPDTHAEYISRGALEVLASIAIRQPVTMSDLTAWFDADKRSQLDALLERGLIEKVRDSSARVHYATTGEFLRQFKLRDTRQLLEALEAPPPS